MAIKILLTWWSWFVWKNLISSLNSSLSNYEIYNLSNEDVTWSIHVPLKDNEIFDFSTLADDFDYIIHTLWLSSDRYCQDFDLTEKMNIEFTKEVLNFAKRQKSLKKLLYFSSITLYDNTNTPPVKETDAINPFYWNYSFTKWIAEYYVLYFTKQFNLPTVTLRISNMYWPGQRYLNSPFLIPEKIYEGLTDWIMHVQNWEPIRDWLFIEDAIDWMKKLLFSEHTWVFNLGGWKWLSVREIIEEISKQLEVPCEFGNQPARWPVKFYSDISKIKNSINWEPKTSLEQWIRKTIDFIKFSI